MINWTITFCSIAVLFSVTAMILACVAIAFVVGLKYSTHKIQWVPVPDPEQKPQLPQAAEGDPFNPEEAEKKSMNKLLQGMKTMYSEDE